MMKMIKDRGFTLIEAMIVLLVVAILVSLVAANMGRSTEVQKHRALIMNLSLVRSAIVSFIHNNNGALPGTDQNPTFADDLVTDLVQGGFLDEFPQIRFPTNWHFIPVLRPNNPLIPTCILVVADNPAQGGNGNGQADWPDVAPQIGNVTGNEWIYWNDLGIIKLSCCVARAQCVNHNPAQWGNPPPQPYAQGNNPSYFDY